MNTCKFAGRLWSCGGRLQLPACLLRTCNMPSMPHIRLPFANLRVLVAAGTTAGTTAASTLPETGSHWTYAQVQDFMMQGGKGWNRDVLALPGCGAEMSSAGALVW